METTTCGDSSSLKEMQATGCIALDRSTRALRTLSAGNRALLRADDEAALLRDMCKAFGVKLLIDDFGTGYSSLSYLQRFPFDLIKIDQSFVMPMLENPDSAAIVRSTIELGHILGRQVVAEGVESSEIWEGLHEQGCDLAQGYFIGKPMPIEEFQQWKANWNAAHA